MLRVLVRSKRDADAVKASFSRFPETSEYEVESLGGVRGGALAEAVESALEPFTVVLLGREDAGVLPQVEEASRRVPFTAVVLARTKRVRNSTVEMINALMTRARTRIRLAAFWDGNYRLANAPNAYPLELREEPAADTFFIFSRGVEVLSSAIGYRLPRGVYIAEKLPMDHHLVFAGPEAAAEFNAASGAARPRGRLIEAPKVSLPASLADVAESNRSVLRVLEAKTVEMIRRYLGSHRGPVVVPLSGGKDSEAALYVAVKALGPERVKAVYVDTGIDFEESAETARRAAEALAVELIEVHAGVDKGLLLERMPLPSPDNRWCTGRKLAALKRAVDGLAARGDPVLIVGDRDAESDRRSRRPLMRVGQGLPYPTLAPLRLWSGAHVEALLALHGLPINPLYEMGFYRTGCYLCFSLRGWEIEAMRLGGVLDSLRASRPGHEKLIERFLAGRGGG